MSTLRNLIFSLALMAIALATHAADYTTFLTPERGFTEVKKKADILGGNDYCYILTSADDTELIVGVGVYEKKPTWASENTKTLRYFKADADPVQNLSNFFTIEKSGSYIGLRNVFYNSSFFQTHENMGNLYILTNSSPTLTDWCYLTPTYQNSHWRFESGKYPMSSGNWARGYLGPWNKKVEAGEPMSLNHPNTGADKAGHYRLFRIATGDLMLAWSRLIEKASDANKIDMSWLIMNPSFETGAMQGWTFAAFNDQGEEYTEYNDVKVCKSEDIYTMSNTDGTYLMNAYQWWAPSMNLSQVVKDIPSGKYELSAIVSTWADREMTFAGNGASVTTRGAGDAVGIPVAFDVDVDGSGELTITASATADWWSNGHPENASQTFFKVDNVQLRCKGLYLQAMAQPLPNDEVTLLQPGVWYYYEPDYPTDYWLVGNTNNVVYSTDAMKFLADVSMLAVPEKLALKRERIYFKTFSSDATLMLKPAREIQELGTLTTVALNVDGLPNKIGSIELNPDGPGSDGTKKISQYLASKSYDVIGCSEDFNYNGSLMSALEGTYSCGTIRKTLSVGDIDYWQLIQGKIHVDTDGLNLIWKNDKVSVSNESWTKWNDSEATDGNQYINKGYRHYDMTLDGNVIDVFILHMDAGDTNASWSRESQWRQLAEAVNWTDPARPKLIIGDTNSRWTREDIMANFMNRLRSDIIPSDVWVELWRDGVYPTTLMDHLVDQSVPRNYTNYEVVDKIIYINSITVNSLQLIPKSFRIEQDYTYGKIDGTSNTTPLGDHKPVVVTFKYIQAGAYVDAIESPEAAPSARDEEKKMYDLSGRAVNPTTAALRRGVYIVNGKKVLVR